MLAKKGWWLCLLAGLSIVVSGGGTGAVQRETQEEKEHFLKQQAKGGLFQRWAFDHDQPDGSPAGFTAMATSNVAPVRWVVRPAADAPSPPHIVTVLAQCERKPCYQLLMAQGLRYEYPDLSVRFRGTEGMGGVVFGAQNPANFYAAMVDLAKSTAQVIRVVDGNEQVLAQTPVTLKQVEWHSLRVQRNTIISKDFIEMFVDGVLVLSIEDQTLGLGEVGLLAGGDTSLSFDTFHAVPLFSHRPLSPPPAY